jgi:hypothetical protein
MKHTTQATVTWAECGDRHTFVGTQWEVTVAAEVWPKTHGRAAHDGETVAVGVDRPGTRQRSAGPGGRV